MGGPTEKIRFHFAMTILKFYGFALIVLGIPLGLTALDGLLPVSYWLAAGLVMIFFGPERINDERVQQLKMKALFNTMSAGLGLSFLAYVLIRANWKQAGPIPPQLDQVISAWDFLAGVLLVSLGLFHFYRWQDDRPVPEGPEEPATFEWGGRTFHRAPWSTMLKALSFGSTVVILGVAGGLLWRAGLPGRLGAVALTLLWLGNLCFMIRGYAIDGDTLLVRRLGWFTRVPLAGLISAAADRETFRDSTRVFGNGGAFSFSGWFRSERLGTFRAYVTDPARAVVLRWADRTVVVSPAAPEEFVRGLPVREAKS